MLSSITQLKGMKTVPCCLLEVLITVSITCLRLRFKSCPLMSVYQASTIFSKKKGEFYNYSGCGNTFNCNYPVVRQFIVDCLRYWVTEMHVDAFCFDLASIMTRGSRLCQMLYYESVYTGHWCHFSRFIFASLSSLWDAINVYGSAIEGDFLTTGTPLVTPPLVDMISNDPILHGVKLIAEAWDAGGLYQVGMFPHWGSWSGWNGKEGGRPWNSINFVGTHDGFTLADLVTYNTKHNLANGEDNNDGERHNNIWNCGQGVPMLCMGDEYGHTKGGNNNTYCHDNYVFLYTFVNTLSVIPSFYFILFYSFLWLLLCCRLITFDGIRKKSPHRTFSDFAAS